MRPTLESKNAHLTRHRAARPVRAGLWSALRAPGDHFSDLLGGDGLLAARARRILQHSLHAQFQESAALKSAHAGSNLHLFRDQLVSQTLRCQQNNPAALRHPLWGGSPPHQPLQLRPRCGTQLDRSRYPHTGHLYSMI